MKLNTHDRTPRPKLNKLTRFLFAICAVLEYGIFVLGAFACIYYAESILGGICMIIIPIIFTLLFMIPFRDMEKAYIEIVGNNIYVVDYYLGIKKEKFFLFSDITSAEIVLGNSHRVKGYRENIAGTRYIVFKKNEKYLFKIIDLPETEALFKRFLHT